MAIVEMKKMTLAAMIVDRAKLMRRLQRLGCADIIENADNRPSIPSAESARRDELAAWIARLDTAIKKLAPYDPIKRGAFSQKPAADEATVAGILAWRRQARQIADRADEIGPLRAGTFAREAREKSLISALRPWSGLTAPLESIGETRNTVSGLLIIPERKYDAFTNAALAWEIPAAFDEINRAGGKVYVLMAAHKLENAAMDSLIKENGAARAQFNGLLDSAQINIDRAEVRLKRAVSERADLDREIAQLGKEIHALRTLRDVEAVELDRLNAMARVRTTRSAFIINAWVPADNVTPVEQAVRETVSAYELEFSDPGDSEKPPTLLKNSRLFRPFEAIINLFSLPDPRGIDATVMISPFFICFFGFMVSDAGYGAAIAVSAALFIWQYKPQGQAGQIAAILIPGGLGTLLWGVLFGGWFGVAVKPVLLSPMEDPLGCILLCLGLGYVHVLVGVCVAAYMNIKRGRLRDMAFDQASWLLVLTGLPAAYIPLPFAINLLGKCMAAAGLLTVLLTGGRHQKNIIKRLISGAGKLYDIAGYLSDVLSYVRLFGMGLATGIIGMVVNMLAGLMMSNWAGFILGAAVLIAGHGMNLAINVLGAYVNACRLQYIEFFGRFYEQGGVPFKPFRYNTRYVEIINH